jgi:hypothetical protein
VVTIDGPNGRFPPAELRIATDGDMRDLGRAAARSRDLGSWFSRSARARPRWCRASAPGGVRARHLADVRDCPVHPPLAGATGPVHADAYRLGSFGEVDDLDLDTDAGSAVTVVEWGTGLAEPLAEDRLEITIEPDQDSDVRTVRINGHGARWHGVLTGAVDRL